MGGFDHSGHHGPREQEGTQTITRNARYGMLLFVVYLLLYGGFMLINAFDSSIMERIVWRGVNLAILYGFGLILAAVALALVYGWLCRQPAASDRSSSIEG
jgi:uncharacterized membrane protein (DUF485 family)